MSEQTTLKVNPRDVFSAFSHYDRRAKNRTQNIYRFLTFDECRNISGHSKIIGDNGEVYDVKINGAVKTWKTRPGDLSIPVKYGLYECFRVEWKDGKPVGRNQLCVEYAPSEEEEERIEWEAQKVSTSWHGFKD